MSDPTPQTHYLVRRPNQITIDGLTWDVLSVDEMLVTIGDRHFGVFRSPLSYGWTLVEAVGTSGRGTAAVACYYWGIRLLYGELSFAARLISSRGAMGTTTEYLRETTEYLREELRKRHETVTAT